MGDLMSAVVMANVVCILDHRDLQRHEQARGRRRSSASTATAAGARQGAGAEEQAIPPRRGTCHPSSPWAGASVIAGASSSWATCRRLPAGPAPVRLDHHPGAAIKIFGLLPEGTRGRQLRVGRHDLRHHGSPLLVGVSHGLHQYQRVPSSLTDPMFLLLTVSHRHRRQPDLGPPGLAGQVPLRRGRHRSRLGMADTGGSGDVSVLSAANACA